MKFAEPIAFLIGPVPVLLKPYLSLSLGIETHKIKITATAQWTHSEKWKIGYEYLTDKDGKVKVNAPTKEQKTVSNEMESSLTLTDDAGNQCGLELGFSVIFTPQIGVAFYELLSVYIEMPFNLKFTAIVPDEEVTKKKKSATFRGELCDIPITEWYVSTWWEITTAIKGGCKAEMAGLFMVSAWKSMVNAFKTKKPNTAIQYDGTPTEPKLAS